MWHRSALTGNVRREGDHWTHASLPILLPLWGKTSAFFYTVGTSSSQIILKEIITFFKRNSCNRFRESFQDLKRNPCNGLELVIKVCVRGERKKINKEPSYVCQSNTLLRVCVCVRIIGLADITGRLDWGSHWAFPIWSSWCPNAIVRTAFIMSNLFNGVCVCVCSAWAFN